jgi:E3 ubiquitin-protein ligase SHPRH
MFHVQRLSNEYCLSTIVNTNQLQRFSNRPEPPVTPQSISREEAVPAIRRKPDYNFIGYSLFAHIQEFESEGSYGSKIQTLVQHLLYIQDADPGAKSIGTCFLYVI